MTRNEAITCIKKHMPDLRDGARVIDFYIEMGMLEVEKEKSIDDKIRIAFQNIGITSSINGALFTLNEAGLKIVEKDK